ncbi:MAG: YHS domain-containing protein [Lentisphaeraceae bacterium]|nr:YHS domain-containing protein [Lentisphaeraceae bacterium]
MKYLMILIITFITFTCSAKEKVFTKNNKAIDGYDTVSYFTQNKAMKGKKEFKHEHKGATWHFSSEENLKLFIKNPEKYTPEYGGYCAYGIGEGGYLAPVDPTAFKILKNRLFLNYSHSVNKKWLKDKDNYIQNGDKVWREKYTKAK